MLHMCKLAPSTFMSVRLELRLIWIRTSTAPSVRFTAQVLENPWEGESLPAGTWHIARYKPLYLLWWPNLNCYCRHLYTGETIGEFQPEMLNYVMLKWLTVCSIKQVLLVFKYWAADFYKRDRKYSEATTRTPLHGRASLWELGKERKGKECIRNRFGGICRLFMGFEMHFSLLVLVMVIFSTTSKEKRNQNESIYFYLLPWFIK